MSVLMVLPDPHDDKQLFDEYTRDLGDNVRGGFLEMIRCKELESELFNYDSTMAFLEHYLDCLPGKNYVFPIVLYVLDFVREKNIDFWMAGLKKDMKNNIEEIISENDFERGVYFFVIGKYHKEFFIENLEHLFLEKFDKVTYYKSSS